MLTEKAHVFIPGWDVDPDTGNMPVFYNGNGIEPGNHNFLHWRITADCDIQAVTLLSTAGPIRRPRIVASLSSLLRVAHVAV